MMSALTLEYPVVFTLKKAFHTERPNGKSDGFPSGHAAGAVTLAAMLGEHFGLIPGLAGYVFAGFVAFHRIDAGNHDLSDVIFGATLGYVFGKTVAETDELPVLHARLVPYGGDRVSGLALQWRF
jgi:membrane-associated phospholipid phosphatase